MSDKRDGGRLGSLELATLKGRRGDVSAFAKTVRVPEQLRRPVTSALFGGDGTEHHAAHSRRHTHVSLSINTVGEPARTPRQVQLECLLRRRRRLRVAAM